MRQNNRGETIDKTLVSDLQMFISGIDNFDYILIFFSNEKQEGHQQDISLGSSDVHIWLRIHSDNYILIF